MFYCTVVFHLNHCLYSILLLTGVETLTDYRFKYGRNPLLELPLAVNPTGCARTEPKLRNQFLWKRPHTQRTGSSSRPIFVPTATVAGEAACPYSKQFVHSKSSQYKKMKQEWRNNVYLARYCLSSNWHCFSQFSSLFFLIGFVTQSALRVVTFKNSAFCSYNVLHI